MFLGRKIFLNGTRKVTLVILLCVLALIPLSIYGQGSEGNSSLLPGISSPTAASLGAYGDIPVSLFTGRPNISIPLYNLKSSQLSLPLTLNYNGGGVKVQEIPGWVGLGWSLNAGGVITRTVRGIPDDKEIGFLYLGGEDAAQYLSDPSQPGFEVYLEDVYQRELDGEPDQYFYNFAGGSGQIFIERDTSTSPATYNFFPLPQKDIKIEVQKGATSTISSWVLTTEDGTKYTFDQTETSTQYTGAIGMQYTSSWYLTKIESATGNDEINLTYQSDTGVSSIQPIAEAYDTLPNGYDPCTPDNYHANSTSTSSGVYLQEIKTANQRVTFHRKARNDNGGLALDSIRVEHQTLASGWGLLRIYAMKTGYFNAGGPALSQRLRLDGLKQYDSESNLISFWSFSYNSSYALPPRDSYSRDHWGYFNGKSNSELWPRVTYDGTIYPGADREPSEAHSKAGSLTEITYPTGGTTTFTWEGHRYGPSNTLGGGIRIKRIEHDDGIDPSGDNIVLEYQYSEGELLRDPKVYNVHSYSRRFSDGVVRNCIYLSRTSSSYVAPGMMQGSVIMYPQVTVLHGPNGEDGKTIKDFNIPDVSTPYIYWPYTPTIVEAWGGGYITSSEQKEANGATRSLKSYIYSSANEKFIRGVVVGLRIVDYTGNPLEKYDYKDNIYTVRNSAYFPISETHRIYSSDGTEFMSRSVEYEYENMPGQVQITGKTEINSDNTQRISEYVYAHEVPDDNGSQTGGIDYTEMKDLNMLSQLYSVTVTDGTGELLKKRWTFWSDSTGYWRPRSERIWTGQ